MAIERRIRCIAVEVPAETNGMNAHTRPRFRPSDLLPWADPYIASLVKKLQDEVRVEYTERRQFAVEDEPQFEADLRYEIDALAGGAS